MRKLCLMFTMLIVLSFASIASASYNDIYDDHLGGDRNYILVDGHMGVAWYLDRSSLVVQKYAPPQYIIAVNIVTVPNADKGYTDISSVQTKRFFYNWKLRQMYVDRGVDNWIYVPRDGSFAEVGITGPTGEMAFYLAYGMKFYGNRNSDFYRMARY